MLQMFTLFLARFLKKMPEAIEKVAYFTNKCFVCLNMFDLKAHLHFLSQIKAEEKIQYQRKQIQVRQRKQQI